MILPFHNVNHVVSAWQVKTLNLFQNNHAFLVLTFCQASSNTFSSMLFRLNPLSLQLLVFPIPFTYLLVFGSLLRTPHDSNFL